MELTNVGKCLINAQWKRQVTNKKMAEDFGVVRQQVEKWRKMEDMHLHKIERFAQYFDMSREEFLKGE
jgi:hypothetical protein